MVRMQKSKRKRSARKAFLLIIISALLIFACVKTGLHGASKVGIAKAKHQPAAQDYLVLVNWEHPIDDNISPELVYLYEVIDSENATFNNAEHQVEHAAGSAANQMFAAAKREGIEGYIINSAYRSAAEQWAIWQNRLDQDPSYGSDPYNSPVKAMPGDRSEHSTGLALDILSKTHNAADDAYGSTVEGKWLAEHAHKYGFILRYPKDKEHITGVIYEPWHFRYVGVDAATEIYEKGLCLEEYLLEVYKDK